jgi:hypothetical protein
MAPTCQRCGYVAYDTAKLKQHLARKFPCEPLSPESPSAASLLDKLTKPPKTFACTYCDKFYTSKESVTKHIQKYHETPPSVEPLDASLLHQQMQTLQSHMSTIMAHLSNASNAGNAINGGHHNTVTNNHNVINNYVHVNAYRHEYLEYLRNREFLDQCARRTDQGILEYLAAKHCSDDHPENHNLRATNVKPDVMHVMTENGWEVVPYNIVTAECVEDAVNVVAEHFAEVLDEEDIKRLSPNLLKQKQMREFFKEIDDDEKRIKIEKPLKRQFYCLVLNHTKRAVNIHS